jgi:glyoxylase I family protein
MGTVPTTAKPALHHVAFACRDLEATHHFYSDLLGLSLVHTEVSERRGSWLKHVFYDLGDGSALAFFALHDMGEPSPLKTAVSTDLGLPVWVNHVALRADEERVAAVEQRLAAAGVELEMELDHGWCRSHYVVDPNGILVELCVDTPGFEPDPIEAERILRQPVASG